MYIGGVYLKNTLATTAAPSPRKMDVFKRFTKNCSIKSYQGRRPPSFRESVPAPRSGPSTLLWPRRPSPVPSRPVGTNNENSSSNNAAAGRWKGGSVTRKGHTEVSHGRGTRKWHKEVAHGSVTEGTQGSGTRKWSTQKVNDGHTKKTHPRVVRPDQTNLI